MELWDILDGNGNKTGRTIERGKPMGQDEYHLLVHIWIKNSKGEFLITKHTPNKKTLPNMWETTVGFAIAGENSLQAALREVKEEIGVDLLHTKDEYLFRLKRQQHDFSDFIDVWLFKEDVDIKEVVYQPEEVCGAKWASPSEIQSSIESGEFADTFTYLEDLFKMEQVKNIKKHIADLFNKIAPTFDDNGPKFFTYFGEKLVELADIKQGEKVLDIASGKGASFFSSIEKVGENGRVIGIDIAEAMIDEINLEIQRRGVKNVDVMMMDAEKLEFSNETFNHILCGFGIFFFPNYKVALHEFMRTLKKGGRFSFTTFSRKKDEIITLSKIVKKYLPTFQDELDEYQKNDVPEFDTEEGLYKILNEAGFKNIRIISEEKTFIYKDEQEWWDKLKTHSYIKILEMIPKDKMNDFKTEVFEMLRKVKKSEGISAKMFVLYGFGEK